jgi:PAS domain S-box-containing protein
MATQPETSTEEIKRLRRCINDLVSILALPAIWTGGAPSQIISNLLDVLVSVLSLDFVYARLGNSSGSEWTETIRIGPTSAPKSQPQEISEKLRPWLMDDSQEIPPVASNFFDGRDIALISTQLGLHGEMGVIVAGSGRLGFPRQTERLILNVAANEAAIGLHEANLLRELDQRVAQRTAELTSANRELDEARTALQRAFDEIKRSETKLRQVIDAIPTMAWSCRPDGHCDYVNRRWLETTGLSEEEALGWGWGAPIHPDDLKRIVEFWRECLATGTSLDTEARMRRFDGTYRWFLFRAEPLRDDSGRILKWYGTNTDIEERKQAEEELRRKEEFLSKAQRLSLSGSFSWYVDSDEVTLSEEAYRIHGFELGTPVTLQRIFHNVHPDDRAILAEKIGGARGSGGEKDYYIRLQMPDGSIKYVRGTSEETVDANGRRKHVGAIQDVSRRHLAEVALAKARSELARVARITAFGALTASIAHEVNQPLSGIVTNASTCLRMLDANPPNLAGARETARRTIRDGNRASEVIMRLRALFGKKTAKFESFNLNEAAKEVLALSESELQHEQVIVKLDLAPDLPAVLGDRIQVQQVILNLIRNGSDAMNTVDDRPRELLIKTETDEGGGVRLSVKDTGSGFDPQNEEKLFDAFYTTKVDGMGIGLSVSRSIMESHRGRLWGIRNDGPGATFLFSIPCGANTEVQ